MTASSLRLVLLAIALPCSFGVAVAYAWLDPSGPPQATRPPTAANRPSADTKRTADPAQLLYDAASRVRTLEQKVAVRELQLSQVLFASGALPEGLSTVELAADLDRARTALEAARGERARLHSALSAAIADLPAEDPTEADGDWMASVGP